MEVRGTRLKHNPAETQQHSQMLYAKDVDGSGQDFTQLWISGLV
jgi:hypothetical protein